MFRVATRVRVGRRAKVFRASSFEYFDRNPRFFAAVANFLEV
jgi:hypothetical protein